MDVTRLRMILLWILDGALVVSWQSLLNKPTLR